MPLHTRTNLVVPLLVQLVYQTVLVLAVTSSAGRSGQMTVATPSWQKLST